MKDGLWTVVIVIVIVAVTIYFLFYTEKGDSILNSIEKSFEPKNDSNKKNKADYQSYPVGEMPEIKQNKFDQFAASIHPITLIKEKGVKGLSMPNVLRAVFGKKK